jgi:creatinine amidohydrolase
MKMGRTRADSRGFLLLLMRAAQNTVRKQGETDMFGVIRIVCLACIAGMSGAARAESVYIEDLTWQEVHAAVQDGKTTAIIYTGSTEQNGPHMALGKHNFVAHYAAGEIAERLGNALVYPTLPFAPTGSRMGRSGHMQYAGSISLDPEIFFAIVRQVAESAVIAGFKNVFIMGDHGGGQEELQLAAKELDEEWGEKGVHVYYVPDLYYKEKDQMKAYLAQHRIPYDAHAGTDDTSEIMFLDKGNKWIRRDKLAASTAEHRPITGVEGDPTKATPELGKMFVSWKIDDAVNQIHQLLASRR